MRHRKAGLKLGKTASHRKSMFKNMITSLFKHDRIRTTDVKVKELRRWADHVITLAKRGDLHARRQVMNMIRDKSVVHELFENAAEKFSNRSSGYTRIIKIGRRAGDAAPISLIELIDSGHASKDSSKSKKKTVSVQPTVKEEIKSFTEKTEKPVEKETESEVTQTSSDSEDAVSTETEEDMDMELSEEVEAKRAEVAHKESEKNDLKEDGK